MVRLDGIGQACQRLPEDHGIIFPGGYYLATGVSQTFDTDVAELEFERIIRSPNGEDVLYVFHARAEGRSLLLPYNVIRKEVATPIPCHGFSLFDDGTLVVFRADLRGADPGPPDAGLADAVPLRRVRGGPAGGHRPAGAGRQRRPGPGHLRLPVGGPDGRRDAAPPPAVYEALIAACARIVDHYHWLGERRPR